MKVDVGNDCKENVLTAKIKGKRTLIYTRMPSCIIGSSISASSSSDEKLENRNYGLDFKNRSICNIEIPVNSESITADSWRTWNGIWNCRYVRTLAFNKSNQV